MKRKGKSGKHTKNSALSRMEETPDDASRHSLRPWFLALLLLGLVGAAFGPLSTHDFNIWDDMDNLVRNEDFNPPTFRSVLRYWHPKNTARGLYAPATYTLWGLVALVPGKGVGTPPESPLNPHAYHSLNLAIHLLSVLAVFMLLRLVLRPVAVDGKLADWAACAGALLFGLHPVQVEAVGWISGTKDVLCGLFGVVAVWQYAAYVRARGEADKSLSFPRVWHWHYLTATGAFLMAMFAKPSGVAVPLVAGGLAFFAMKRSFLQVVVDHLPLLALAGLFIYLNKEAQQQGQDNRIPLYIRPFIAGDAISFYLYKLFVPVKFCFHYGRNPQQWFAQRYEWKYITGTMPYALAWGILAVMWLAQAARESLRWLLAGAAVFVAGVLPVLGFVGFMYQRHSTVADHYLYLSMLGPALFLGRVLAGKRSLPRWGVAVGWLVVLGVLAALQVPKWKDSETLLQHGIAANPNSWIAYNNLAILERDRGNYEEAAALCRKALKINPVYAHAHTNLGLSLIDLERFDEGMAHLERACELDPSMERYYGTAAGAKYTAGTAYEHKGDIVRAIAQYRESLEIEPNSFDTRFRLGVCLKNTGRPEEAETQFAEALKIKPDDARTYFNLGLVLAMQKKTEQAVEQYREAIRLDPGYAHAHNNLGLIHEGRGEFAEAVAHYEKAVENAPDMAQAGTNLQRARHKLAAR